MLVWGFSDKKTPSMAIEAMDGVFAFEVWENVRTIGVLNACGGALMQALCYFIQPKWQGGD